VLRGSVNVECIPYFDEWMGELTVESGRMTELP
jgi:hypothetical protein